MKKIFTLIFALLIAGSVYASDYLYIEDFEIDRSTWQATVPLKAHFDDYVSAIQVELTLPAGMVVNTIANEYELTIEHEDDDGLTVGYYPTVAVNQNGTVIIVLSMESDYYEGQWMGVAKYSPGDYEFFNLIIDVPMGWEPTGDIGVYSVTGCGKDKRPWVHCCTGCDTTTTTNITMVGEAVLPPKPTDVGYWIVMDNSNPMEIDLDCPYEVWYGSMFELSEYHFVINGKEMGAFRPNQPTYLTGLCPLINGTNNYTLEGHGNKYTLTLLQEGDSYYVKCVKGGGADDVTEPVEDKQVKDVRYYNPMGQQMREPNGITIVVTEYTDGTTTTEKVLR